MTDLRSGVAGERATGGVGRPSGATTAGTVPAIRITFGFSECPTAKDGTSFVGPDCWERANRYLAGLPGPGEGCYKTDFSVAYEDGEIYRGCYDLDGSGTTLGAHVRRFLSGVLDEGDWRVDEADRLHLASFRDHYDTGA